MVREVLQPGYWTPHLVMVSLPAPEGKIRVSVSAGFAGFEPHDFPEEVQHIHWRCRGCSHIADTDHEKALNELVS